MATTVVHVRREKFDVYIGRQSPRGDGYFGNPYVKKARQPLPVVLVKYREHFANKIKTDKEFHKRCLELRGKVLGCYCKPEDGFNGRLLCHGQIIAGWVDGINPEYVN